MSIQLSEEQIKEIAEEAAKIAVVKMQSTAYEAVGKTVVNKFLQFIGIAAVGLGLWLYDKGLIKIG